MLLNIDIDGRETEPFEDVEPEDTVRQLRTKIIDAFSLPTGEDSALFKEVEDGVSRPRTGMRYELSADGGDVLDDSEALADVGLVEGSTIHVAPVRNVYFLLRLIDADPTDATALHELGSVHLPEDGRIKLINGKTVSARWLAESAVHHAAEGETQLLADAWYNVCTVLTYTSNARAARDLLDAKAVLFDGVEGAAVRVRSAFQILEEVLQMCPTHDDAWAMLGMECCLSETMELNLVAGEPPVALTKQQLLRRAISCAPTAEDAVAPLANLAHTLPHRNDSVTLLDGTTLTKEQCFHRTLESDEDDSSLWFYLASTLDEGPEETTFPNGVDGASAAYTISVRDMYIRSVELDPCDPDCWKYLSKMMDDDESITFTFDSYTLDRVNQSSAQRFEATASYTKRDVLVAALALKRDGRSDYEALDPSTYRLLAYCLSADETVVLHHLRDPATKKAQVCTAEDLLKRAASEERDAWESEVPARRTAPRHECFAGLWAGPPEADDAA
eukprot:Rhum_TRINITY_DN18645_c0_g1::Rhum_TRINITY_DN18645_c0_g1_i1::g.167867::m.167867